MQSLGTSRLLGLLRLLRLACHGFGQAFIDGEGGSWNPYYHGIGPINKEGSMGGGKTTSLP